MSDYAKYIQEKALIDFYNGLSDEDKKKFIEMYNNRSVEVNNDRPISVYCRDPYFRGVSQNIVGDAIYDIGLRVLKKFISKL